MAEAERPSLVILRSHIGWPSPKYTDTAKAHGSALGADEVAAVKDILGLPPDDFYAPDDVVAYYRDAGRRGRESAARRGSSAGARVPRARARRSPTSSTRASSSAGLPGWEAKLPSWNAGEALATRQACTAIVERGARRRARRWSCGGADLTENTGMELERRAGHRNPPVRRSADALGHPRARHGCGDERHGGQRAAPRRRHVLRLQRLHARRGAPRRALAVQDRVRVDARLGRPRRGRAHAPTGRAPGVAARDARAAAHPSGRRQRDRAGVAGARRRRRPDRARAHPPEAPRARRHRGARARGRAPRGATCSSTKSGDGSTSCSSAPAPRCRCASTARDLLVDGGSSVRVVSMPSWDLFAAQTDEYRDAGAATRRPDARGRGRREPRVGAVRRRRRRRSTTSARRRPARPCWPSSGSRRRTWQRVHARCSRPEEMRHDERDRPAQRLRAEPLVRQPRPPVARRRRAAVADHRRRHPRRHVEPHHPRQGDRRRRGLRRAARRVRERRPVDRRHLLGGRGRRHRGRHRRAAPGVRRARSAATASCRSRCHPTLAHDTDGTIDAARSLCGTRRPPERDDQDPGHARGHPRDRGDDRSRDQRERHADLLARPPRRR